MLQFDALTVGYDLAGGGRVDVLRDVSLTIAEGQQLGIVGESGAGKSMLTRALSGRLPPGFRVTSGDIRLAGTEIFRLSPKARREWVASNVAFIPQEPLSALNPVRTIYDQFNEYLAHRGIERARRKTLIGESLRATLLPDVDHLQHRYPHQLSGGQCQRVLIAMAFSCEPKVIIADEPTTALDAITQKRLMSLLGTMQESSGVAALLITHDLELAQATCHQIGVLYAGEICELRSVSAGNGSPMHPYSRALQTAAPTMEEILQKVEGLPGRMPQVSELAAIHGCRFNERCPNVLQSCVTQPAQLRPTEDGRSLLRCVNPNTEDAHSSHAHPGKSLDVAAPDVVKFESVSLNYVTAKLPFQKRKQTAAVRNVSFSVRRGERMAIIGESGSGKSSIAQLLVGLRQPTAGTIALGTGDRAPVGHGLASSQVQMVFQDPHSALNPRRSVAALLTQGFEIDPDFGKLLKTRKAQEAAQDVDLSLTLLNRYPHQLSGGQKQRVNIGRALSLRPSVLVADEIVSGLDVSVQANILNLLIDLNARHDTTIIFITHDLLVARYLCQSVVVMKEGSIVEQGDIEDVLKFPAHDYTRSLVEAARSSRRGPIRME